MGLIDKMFGSFFGGGRNAVVEMAEVFRENAEAGAIRAADAHSASLGQFAAEFQIERTGWFDRFMDGVNRLPRPALALGTLSLFVAAMFDPVWFSNRMVGLQSVPEPLWWLLGAIVSFYFGARHQTKGQQFQKSLAKTLASRQIKRPALDIPSDPDAEPSTGNAALDDWRRWNKHNTDR